LTFDSAGNMYIADGTAIRKVSTTGIITTVAGGVSCCALGDGALATSANLSAPSGIAVDAAGNMYIADTGNGRVRKVSSSGIISTYAGGGSQVLASPNTTQATFAILNRPNSLVLDPAGNLYFADAPNSASGVVYKVSASGTLSIVAGGPSNFGPPGYGDGGLATTASLSQPTGLALDAAGNLYIAVAAEKRVRKVTPGGMISTVAGSNSGGYSGDGGPANQAGLSFPYGVAVDSSGSLYISDQRDERIRMVAPNGNISTIAGDGLQGFSGDGRAATNAMLNTPAGLAIKASVLYIADDQNNRVRTLTPSNVSTGGQPSIRSANGVVTASAFGGFSTIAPGTWIEIYGSNLATNRRSWGGADFNGATAPTALDGTQVSVGGQSAFVAYISPGQVNAQVPSNVATGPQSVVVITAAGQSSPYSVNVAAAEPGLWAPSSFSVNGQQYVVAQFTDGSYVAPPGAIAGVNSRRAVPSDTIAIYGVGFGAVAPIIEAGQVVQQANTLTGSFQIKFGSTAASATYDGLAPNLVGLYQFNVVVPSIPSSDAVPVTFSLNGVAGAQTLYTSVENGAPAATMSLTLAASTVPAGGTVAGTVTLAQAAPAGGAVVGLSSNSPSARVPSTVTVAASATSATFTIYAPEIAVPATVTITATYQGSSATATLTVQE
jgi:uncharacterized protein (TIGR03437 family)